MAKKNMKSVSGEIFFTLQLAHINYYTRKRTVTLMQKEEEKHKGKFILEGQEGKKSLLFEITGFYLIRNE